MNESLFIAYLLFVNAISSEEWINLVLKDKMAGSIVFNANTKSLYYKIHLGAWDDRNE